MINAIVTAEKLVHGPSVTFKLARVFTTSGLNGVTDAGSMIHILELSGAGSASTTNAGLYRETAVLVKWELPRKSVLGLVTGRQRSLKKWIHCCASAGMATNQMEGYQTLSGGFLTTMGNYATSVENPVSGSQLISPDGTEPSNGAVVHPYLEHRQFPRGRKES